MKTAPEKCVRQGGEGRGPGEGRSSIRKPQGRHHEPRSDGRSLRRVLWLRTGPHPHGRSLSGVACVGGGVDSAQGTASHSVHTLSDMDRQRLRLPERRGTAQTPGSGRLLCLVYRAPAERGMFPGGRLRVSFLVLLRRITSSPYIPASHTPFARFLAYPPAMSRVRRAPLPRSPRSPPHSLSS